MNALAPGDLDRRSPLRGREREPGGDKDQRRHEIGPAVGEADGVPASKGVADDAAGGNAGVREDSLNVADRLVAGAQRLRASMASSVHADAAVSVVER